LDRHLNKLLFWVVVLVAEIIEVMQQYLTQVAVEPAAEVVAVQLAQAINSNKVVQVGVVAPLVKVIVVVVVDGILEAHTPVVVVVALLVQVVVVLAQMQAVLGTVVQVVREQLAHSLAVQ
jgi:hypothetical protein